MVRFENGRNFDVIEEDGYERWVVPAGEYEVVIVEDGDVIENVVFDVTANGANLYVADDGDSPSGWTIRNVGWDGVTTVDEREYGHKVDTSWAGKFNLACAGDGVIENIYMDNRDPGMDSEMGGGYHPPHHGGEIEVAHSFIAGMGNNAWYGSRPADADGASGSVHFYDCYHRDNTVSQYRIGHDSTVENCVGIANDPDGLRGTYPGSTDSRRARGIWCRSMDGNVARNATMVVSPDDIDPFACYFVQCYGDSSGPKAVLSVENAYGNPDAPRVECVNCMQSSPPCPADLHGEIDTSALPNHLVEGVPTDPVMAARGERHVPDIPELDGSGGSSGGSTDDSTTVDETALSITNDGSDRTRYEVTVDGEITGTEGFGSGDEVTSDGTHASGFVRGGIDTLRYTGCVSYFEYTGPDPSVYRDGTRIDLGAVVECPPEEDTSDGSTDDSTDSSGEVVASFTADGVQYEVVRKG